MNSVRTAANPHAAVWRIAFPLILSNVTVPLLGMVDTAVVGHLDSAHYLAAVGVGATIFGFLFMGLNFLRMGTTGLTAQAFGADQGAELRNVLGQALLTAWTLGVLLIVLRSPALEFALRLIAPGDLVREQAEVYYNIRIWSAPAVLANYALLGWFIGLQNARVPLAIAIIINVINIGLDLWLVLGLHLDVAGVAAASVVAELIGMVVGLLLAVRVLRAHPGKWQRELLFDRTRIARLFSVNVNLLLRTLALAFAFAFLTARGARKGDLVLAANTLLLNFQFVMSFALDGLANAAEALVGQAHGKRDRSALRQAVIVTLGWSGLIAMTFSLLYLIAGHGIINLLTDLDDVREVAVRYLPWLVLSPLISVWSFVYDGVFVGLTRAAEMRTTMLLSTFAVFVPAALLLDGLGNHGLWLALMLFLLARGASLHWLFWRDLDARPAAA